jgi:succinate dehydrogenase / fumarate reductase, cytochrome b subunit
MSWLTNTLSPVGLGWFGAFLTSSIGKKVLMALTGLFLISFLPIHLLGNLYLMKSDGGRDFNLYAEFMTHNKIIKTISYTLYLSILLHAIQGLLLWAQNAKARDQKYAVKVTRAVGTNARAATRMGWIGTIVLVFILIHLYQFWLQMKLGNVPMASYGGEVIKDLYTPVSVAFTNPLFVAFYVLSMLVIAFHLWHGFQSAFQTLGLNHSKYTPFIRALGQVYSIVIPAGFAIIPIYMYGNALGYW